MEGVLGKMRRKCMRRAAGHTALRGKRKQEGNFQNGGREEPFLNKTAKSTILGLDTSSRRNNKRQAPKP